MAGNINSNSGRFAPFNRGYSGGNLNIAGGSFNGAAPTGFGGVGSFGSNTGAFNSFNGGGFNNSFGGGNFNSFGNPYQGGGNIGGFGGGGIGQVAFMIGAAIPGLVAGIIHGIQAIFQGRGDHANSEECGPCERGGHDNNSGHPDMSAHGSYQDGQDLHRIDEAGVNMSFEMDY